MDRAAFQVMMGRDYDEIKEINDRKGHDYAGDQDALSNFKEAARSTGLTPEQVWSVYASKHWAAVLTYCREGQVRERAYRRSSV